MKYSIGPTSFSKLSLIHIAIRNYCCKIPAHPAVPLEKAKEESVHVDKNTLALLERLSLVKCDTAEGVTVLEDSIAFANRILHINTDKIEPLNSVLENENIYLRVDAVTQGNCQKDILKNAVLKEDDYFVAPPGNIPLHEVETKKEERAVKHNEN